MQIWTATLGLLAAGLPLACGGGKGGGADALPVVPRGERILALEVNEAADGDFAAAFAAGQAAGFDALPVSLDWGEVDLGTEAGQPVYDGSVLDAANACLPASDTAVSLVLRPIVSRVASLPPDLEGRAFDDPALIARFEATLDFVLDRIPELRLGSLVIGSEVDRYLGLDAGRQEAYAVFLDAVAAHARAAWAQRRPAEAPLSVAVEVRAAALTAQATRAYYQRLNEASDVIGIAYLPLEDGRVESPEVFGRDLASLAGLHPDRPLFFTRLAVPSGYFSPQLYPELLSGTSAMLETSAARQADWIDAVFAAWDLQRERVAAITFTELHDRRPAAAQAIAEDPAYGDGSADPAFVELVRTLGLRSDAGLPKPAFERLVARAGERGWSDTGRRLGCP